jgi:hypothetical protein
VVVFLAGVANRGEHMSADAAAAIHFKAAVPQFTVPDVVRAAEYYRDVLGFQIAGYWNGERVTFTTDPPGLCNRVAPSERRSASAPRRGC